MGEVIVEQVRRQPAPELRRFVTAYTGYRLEGAEPGVHPGLPSKALTFIVSFDDPLDIAEMPDRRQPPERYWAMVGGLHTRPATVRHDGRQHGIQIELTPLGAVALFRTRPGDLASTVVALGDLDEPLARQLIDRVSDDTGWPERFAALDALLARAAVDPAGLASAIPAPAAAAWELLVRSGGAIAIEELAAHVGWSRRHLSERFRGAFGLAPKELAIVLRFERAQRLLRSPIRPSLAAVAAQCGYADQSHLTRDWRRFAGSPPSAWLSEELPFVQDDLVERPR